jgi:hypothetical protein
MNKSITQDNLNDNKISKSIRKFFTRFHLSSAQKLVQILFHIFLVRMKLIRFSR